MELTFDEITLLQNGKAMEQRIEEVMTVLREKGFEVRIIKTQSFGRWDILYMDNKLGFNLYVSMPVIPVHDK